MNNKTIAITATIAEAIFIGLALASWFGAFIPAIICHAIADKHFEKKNATHPAR